MLPGGPYDNVAWCDLLYNPVVLLFMLPGVPYGVAVHVAWCDLLYALWCCCSSRDQYNGRTSAKIRSFAPSGRSF